MIAARTTEAPALDQQDVEDHHGRRQRRASPVPEQAGEEQREEAGQDRDVKSTD